MIYPALKNEGDDTARECRINTNVRERTGPGDAETPIFRSIFVVDDACAVAKKYSADAAHYPTDRKKKSRR